MKKKTKPTLDKLISDYHAALENHRCDPENDDLKCRLHDCGEALKGRTVSADVKWHNGKISSVAGKVLSTVGEAVYLDSNVGNVEAFADSMEAAE